MFALPVGVYEIIKMVSNRIYDVQKVCKYHELQYRQTRHWIAF